LLRGPFPSFVALDLPRPIPVGPVGSADILTKHKLYGFLVGVKRQSKVLDYAECLLVGLENMTGNPSIEPYVNHTQKKKEDQL
jgi:hypothetical protein